MAKKCSKTGDTVLYLDCLECEEKVCEGGRVMTNSKIVFEVTVEGFDNKDREQLRCVKEAILESQEIMSSMYRDGSLKTEPKISVREQRIWKD